MKTDKQTTHHAASFSLVAKETSNKEFGNVAKMVSKSIAANKPVAIEKKIVKHQPTKKLVKPSDGSKAAFDILKEEINQLKGEIQVRDVEIEKLKLKLVKAKINMDQFTYIASHDLKEPLRMVTSYLGLLKNKLGSQLDNKAKAYIDFALDGGARLHTMFNGLLDLSQTGRIDEPKQMVPFIEIIDEVKISLSKKIREAKAQINIVGDLPMVEVYEKSIMRLMENLVCNAIKFSNPGETPIVEISAKEKGNDWEFCIADNGIGIEANYYQQIFAVFSKLNSSAAYPGNGIGLAICKKAAEHHGGEIWVSSEVNKGSKFYFTLPK